MPLRKSPLQHNNDQLKIILKKQQTQEGGIKIKNFEKFKNKTADIGKALFSFIRETYTDKEISMCKGIALSIPGREGSISGNLYHWRERNLKSA